jgi:hypothetical protein
MCLEYGLKTSRSRPSTACAQRRSPTTATFCVVSPGSFRDQARSFGYGLTAIR